MSTREFRVTKPVERLRGKNLDVLEMLCGNVSVGRSYLWICRDMRRRISADKWKAASRELRRGFFLAVLETHRENRAMYSWVMGGRHGSVKGGSDE